MKKTLVIFAWVVSFIVLTPPIFVLAYFYFGSTVLESLCPTGAGSAILYQESGPLDTVMSLCVRDYKQSGSEPVGLGMVSDWGGQGIAPEKVVWSKDGSVVAAKGKEDWIAAYDFRTHKSVAWEWMVKHDFGKIPKKAGESLPQEISKLLARRGGEGTIIISGQFPSNSFKNKARHAWWWENYPMDKQF